MCMHTCGVCLCVYHTPDCNMHATAWPLTTSGTRPSFFSRRHFPLNLHLASVALYAHQAHSIPKRKDVDTVTTTDSQPHVPAQLPLPLPLAIRAPPSVPQQAAALLRRPLLIFQTCCMGVFATCVLVFLCIVVPAQLCFPSSLQLSPRNALIFEFKRRD